MEKGCLCLDCVSCLYDFHKFKSNGLRTEVDLRIYKREHQEVKIVDCNEVLRHKLPIITNIESMVHCSDSNIKKETTGNKKDGFHKEHLSCSYCNRKFWTNSHYKQHIEYHKKPDFHFHTCEICKFAYPTKDGLTKHMFVHFGEDKKPYQCKICKIGFVSRWTYIIHERKHKTDDLKKIKPRQCYICKECGRDLYIKDKYDEHIEYHKRSYSNRYVCNICKFVYHTQATLNKHTFKHLSGDKKLYQCTECGDKFVEKGRLTVHMRKHTGEKMYRCRLCQYNTKIVTKFHEHIKEKHNIDATQECTDNEDSVNPFLKQEKPNKEPLVLNQYLQMGTSSSNDSFCILKQE